MTFANTEYSRTFTSYSGADIKVTFGNIVVGELASVTYSVTREKAPIFVMGDANPRSFSRGKRGVAGSLVFTVLDRDALSKIKQETTVYRSVYNSSDKFDGKGVLPVHRDNELTDPNYEKWATGARPHYSDEIPPFDISISFLNEYGNMSEMSIYGVEILNEGMGMSIDDITTEKSCTFIARGLSDMRSDEFKKTLARN